MDMRDVRPHIMWNRPEMARHEPWDNEDMSKTAETQGPDAQGKFSLTVSVGGLTTTFGGFSSKMEAEDYAVSFLRRIKELAKEDGRTVA